MHKHELAVANVKLEIENHNLLVKNRKLLHRISIVEKSTFVIICGSAGVGAAIGFVIGMILK